MLTHCAEHLRPHYVEMQRKCVWSPSRDSDIRKTTRVFQRSSLAFMLKGSFPAAVDPLTCLLVHRRNRYVTVRLSLPFVSHLSRCCAFVYFHNVFARLSGSCKSLCHFTSLLMATHFPRPPLSATFFAPVLDVHTEGLKSWRRCCSFK